MLEDAFERGQLAHALLLQGASIESLDAACRVMAGKLLETDAPQDHPDFFSLRPSKKSRRIGIGTDSEKVGGQWPLNSMRRFIADLSLSANRGMRKVGVVYEADRLMPQAANAFLKTLEEPPRDTILFLLTIRPYDLLATIRSRCLLVSFPAESDSIQDPEWRQWLDDYAELVTLAGRGANRSSAPELIIGSYGLITRFQGIQQSLVATAWKAYKATLPDRLSDDEVTALETGYQKSLRGRMLMELETQTRNAALQSEDISTAGRRLDRVTQLLEKASGLLEVNFQEAAALEYFLLSSLRVWARS